MKIHLFTCWSIFDLIYSASAQTGFFLKLDSKTSDSHLVSTVDSKNEFLVPLEPIINGFEFKVADSLQYDPIHNDQYFNIRFTKIGFETLKMICELVPAKELVLVVNGKAITLTNKSKPGQLMRISGPANSEEILWIFKNLKQKK
jgi:hypothetical protein